MKTLTKPVGRKKLPFVRLGTRIRPDQYKYTKDLLKERNKGVEKKTTDGELHREMFDYYINNHKI